MSSEFKSVFISGAVNEIGTCLAEYFAKNGANLVLNDSNHSKLDILGRKLEEIGCKVVLNFDNLAQDSNGAIKAGIEAFGKIDVIINNACSIRECEFKEITIQEWQSSVSECLGSAFSLIKAAWPVFIKQNSGRIINISSLDAIYGAQKSCNSSTVKAGLHGLTMSLAREGARNKIQCNTVAPIFNFPLNIELKKNFSPNCIAPFVGALCSKSCSETGCLFEVGGGFAAKCRIERSQGYLFNYKNLNVDSISEKWLEINNFDSKAMHPLNITETDWLGLVEKSANVSNPIQTSNLRFDQRVVIITGAGSGLGKAYALFFSSLGAKIVVNDVSEAAANAVVDEITRNGGKAVAAVGSVENAAKIVETAVAAFGGRIDILINNAGILRDKSFSRMTINEWNAVINVHLNGSFLMSKAVWPIMIKQNYGRIVNTTSAVGLYGNFGQTNYSAAKAALIGFSKCLALEGRRHNILVNAIAPNAGTPMTATVLPAEIVQALKPDFVAPFVAFLCHEKNNCSGSVFECGSGWISAVRWQRANGAYNDYSSPLISDFSNSTYSNNVDQAVETISSLLNSKKSRQNNLLPSVKSIYSQNDVILYALGIGANKNQLEFVFEKSALFHAIPLYGVIFSINALWNVDFERIAKGLDIQSLVHGEQYLELYSNEIPVAASVLTTPSIQSLMDKKTSTLLVVGTETVDFKSKKPICYNECTVVFRGKGGLVKSSTSNTRKRKYPPVENTPQRSPDCKLIVEIPQNQAVLYRLSGDGNPLHIDPDFAKIAGFKQPILHGLCTLGYGFFETYIRAKPKAQTSNGYAPVAAVQCRMSSIVYLGDKLEIAMWKTSETRVQFSVKNITQNNSIVITNAAVDFAQPISLGDPGFKADTVLPSVETQSSNAVNSVFLKFSDALGKMDEKARKTLVRKTMAVFCFDVVNNSKKTQWTIDLKNDLGKIFSGSANGDITITIQEKDLFDVISGKLSKQKAYMTGQLKVKGSPMLAMKLDPVFQALGTAKI